MSGISAGGLSSGLDTNTIIAQLTAIEQAKVTREEAKKTTAEATLEKFNDLQTRLVNLADKAADLDEAKDFNLFETLSNNDDYAVVSGGQDAVDGTYELVVRQLATTQKIASNSYASTTAPLSTYLAGFTGGTFEVSTSKAAQEADSTKKKVEISISADDTLKDVARKINAADGAGVSASIMTLANGENRLIMTAVDEGTDGFFLTDTSGTDLLGSLGILADKESAASDFALTTLKGSAATTATKFSELSTGLMANNLDLASDKIDLYLDGEATSSLSFSFMDGATEKTVGSYLAEMQAVLDTKYGVTGSTSNVTASLNSSGEIVLTGLDGVAVPSFKMSLADSGQVSSLALGGSSDRNVYSNTLNSAQNAFYTLDGMAVTSQSNKDDSTISGTTFTLKKADPAITVKVSIKQDTSGIVEKIAAFIEEYNSLTSFIDENSKVTMEEKTDENGKKSTSRTKGAFSGDSNISSLKSQLQRMMTGSIDELSGRTQYTSLARVGITTSGSGALEVDNEKLTEALENDIDGVRRLFTVNGFSNDSGYTMGQYTDDTKTGTYYLNTATQIFGSSPDGTYTATDTGLWASGIFTSSTGSSKGLSVEVSNSATTPATFTFVRGVANQFSLFVENAKDYVDGYFKTSKDTYQKRIDAHEERIETLQTRVDKYETRLTAQFTALELAMSKLQSQTSSFLSQLS
jgi:flagellar hook-associated protein 2